MLSFELSAIDLILAVAIIILLVLYLTKSSGKPPVEEKILVRKESSSKEPAIEARTQEEEIEKPMSSQSQPHTGFTECPFTFGYLGKLNKEASIPDGCLGCSRIMECYGTNK